MKKVIHKSETRGSADHGWLKANHTFSFAHYFDAERMGFGALRVINDDLIAPSQGFPTHPHNNMEIITIPLSGCLAHKDTMGNTQVIKSGEVQVMSAGSGLAHSEFNGSSTEEINLLQIWVLPKEQNVNPRYDQKEFQIEDRINQFQLLVSPDERGNSLKVNQDIFFSQAKLEKGKLLEYKLYNDKNGIYIFLIEGEVEVLNERMNRRDGLGVSGIEKFKIEALEESSVLIMEVPMA
ncbi:MAG: pirin family protein [Bacteriovoracaceae bacterium]|nr:pirin family protein [Bacteriovoracaceae bacterium]